MNEMLDGPEAPATRRRSRRRAEAPVETEVLPTEAGPKPVFPMESRYVSEERMAEILKVFNQEYRGLPIIAVPEDPPKGPGRPRNEPGRKAKRSVACGRWRVRYLDPQRGRLDQEAGRGANALQRPPDQVHPRGEAERRRTPSQEEAQHPLSFFRARRTSAASPHAALISCGYPAPLAKRPRHRVHIAASPGSSPGGSTKFLLNLESMRRRRRVQPRVGDRASQREASRKSGTRWAVRSPLTAERITDPPASTFRSRRQAAKAPARHAGTGGSSPSGSTIRP